MKLLRVGQRMEKNLLKMISSLRYLLHQGLALRGHQESEGNLIQLLFLRSEDIHRLGRSSKSSITYHMT